MPEASNHVDAEVMMRQYWTMVILRSVLDHLSPRPRTKAQLMASTCLTTIRLS